jgi:hypothetical protein
MDELSQFAHLFPRGMCAIDIGAGVGHYAIRLAELVGQSGRVFALEPDPLDFDLLASNVYESGRLNVTLTNAGARDFADQLSPGVSAVEAFLDALTPTLPLRFVKVRPAGSEVAVLNRLRRFMVEPWPPLIVETGDDSEAVKLLESWGYDVRRLNGSPNVIATAR